MVIRRLFTMALALLIGTHASGQPPHAGHGQRPALGASAAFDANGRLWAVHSDGEHVRLSASDDHGRTWHPAGKVNAEPEPIAASGDNRPKLVFDPSGRLHVSWTRPLAKPYTGEIRIASATTPGAAFSPPRTVHRDRQAITHRFDAITVARGGELVVSWIDKRDLVAARAKGEEYRGAAIYYAVSRDGGGSFEPERALAAHSCECCRIALAPTRDGNVQALWRHVFDPNVRDHATATIGLDGRDRPVRRATRDEWALDACPHHGPSMVEDRAGRLHAVWFTGAPGREGAYYGRLGADGMEAVMRLPDARAAHADLAFRDDVVVLAWKRFDGQATELRTLRSQDGGDNWGEAHSLARTTGASGQPFVLVEAGRFHVFWHGREFPLGTWRLP